jgi:toxin ParE1/3/4
MKVRYRARAQSDIDAIYLYLEPLSLTGARNVLKAIYSAIALIAEHPYSTERTSDPDIHVKVLGRYRYKIFFEVVDANTVEIIHVRHAARRPWLGTQP